MRPSTSPLIRVSPPTGLRTADERRAGYRLHRLEVLNWGTFDGKTVWKITPDGHTALITGDIGSGKSTLIDGLTALLVPHQKITYNKAAGATSNERSLKSYVLGAHAGQKVEHSSKARAVFLRGEAAGLQHSIVLAYFFNEAQQQGCTLAQVFWMNGEGESTPEKLFLVAETDLSIKTHFSRITEIRKFKKRLREGHRAEFFDSFKAYADRFRQLFGLRDEEALDLFYQTVSMKQVENLTSFVRSHMLPKADVQAEIDRLIAKFKDLEASYQSVRKAKAQLSLLEPIAEGLAAYEAAQAEIGWLDEVVGAIPAFFAFEKSHLLRDELAAYHDLYQAAEANERDLADQLRTLRQRQEDLKLDRQNSEAGQRLARLETDRHLKTDRLTETQVRAKTYQNACEQLGLRPELTEDFFVETRRNLDALEAENERQRSESQAERDGFGLRQQQLTQRQTDLKADIASLRQRATQIPHRYLSLRRQILDQTGLDEAKLPFAGELIRVRDDETAWEMALESRLNQTALSLLVGEADYPAVSQCVDGMRLSDPLSYLRMAPHEGRLPEPDDDSLVWKLQLRAESPCHDWLQRWLVQHHNLTCCETLDAFRRTPSAITREGQVKQGKVRHRKPRPTTRRDYVLGWDNRAQLRLLEDDLHALETDLAMLQRQMNHWDETQKSWMARQSAIGILRNFKAFAEVNFLKIAAELEALTRQEADLRAASVELQTLDKDLKNVEKAIETAEADKSARTKEKGKCQAIVQSLTKGLYTALDRLGALDRDTELHESFFVEEDQLIGRVETWLRSLKKLRITNEAVSPALRAYIHETLLAGVNLAEVSLEKLEQLEQKTKDRIHERNGLKDQAKNRATNHRVAVEKKMSAFQGAYPAETRDFEASVEDLAAREFTELLARIRADDLPRFEEKFRENLHKHVVQNIVMFNNTLERQRNDILGKIRNINERLRELDYDKNAGTIIQIETEKVGNDEDLRQFQADLLQASTNVLGEMQTQPEQKYEEVRAILSRFMSGTDEDRRWTEKVTDVRRWYSFGASERYTETDAVRDYYSDSSGKSGGQKEKLAYTILASAIAYQFGISWDGAPRTFRLVVIDEAFGRGSEDSTRYGLELFAKMNLQLLIVTPLQKIAIIEDYVQAVHFVANPTGQASKITNLSKTEYLERKAEYIPQ